MWMGGRQGIDVKRAAGCKMAGERAVGVHARRTVTVVVSPRVFLIGNEGTRRPRLLAYKTFFCMG
jgi:hypothetical protein